MTVETDRLILRPWAERDRQPVAKMSNDPAVMKCLMSLEGSAATDQWIDRQKAHLAEHGFCFWAMENKAAGAFTGAVGLLRVAYTAHFTPAVEVGWRIPQPFWGQGFASEAAAASIRFGFEMLMLPEIVANTVPVNMRSRRVMERLDRFRLRQIRSSLESRAVPSAWSRIGGSEKAETALGMTHSPVDDFDQPRVPEGHALRRQVLYRLTRHQG
jgi:RimJ/RimL family protein N-acetyltransferase